MTHMVANQPSNPLLSIVNIITSPTFSYSIYCLMFKSKIYPIIKFLVPFDVKQLKWVDHAGSLHIDGTDYELIQCHWHSPSEHIVNSHRWAISSIFLSFINTFQVHIEWVQIPVHFILLALLPPARAPTIWGLRFRTSGISTQIEKDWLLVLHSMANYKLQRDWWLRICRERLCLGGGEREENGEFPLIYTSS